MCLKFFFVSKFENYDKMTVMEICVKKLQV